MAGDAGPLGQAVAESIAHNHSLSPKGERVTFILERVTDE